MGSCLCATKKPNDAEAAFKAAIEKDPNAAIGYSALGEFYGSKHFDQALDTLPRRIKHQTNDNVLHLLLAMTLELSGQYDAAITIEAMLVVDPHSTIAANNLASLLADHSQDPASLDKAYAIANRFADSDVPQFVDTLGWIYYLKGKYDQALLLLKKAADKAPDGNPTTGIMQFHLAMVYKELGLTDKARETLQKAIGLLPKTLPKAAKPKRRSRNWLPPAPARAAPRAPTDRMRREPDCLEPSSRYRGARDTEMSRELVPSVQRGNFVVPALDQGPDLRGYVNLLRRRFLFLVIPAVVTFAGVCAVTYLVLPLLYEAQAKIL